MNDQSQSAPGGPGDKETLREHIAGILETVARDGLPGPRDLDVALDAIMTAIDEERPAADLKPFAFAADEDEVEIDAEGNVTMSPAYYQDAERVFLLLLVAGGEATAADVAAWTDEQRKAAAEWVFALSLAASDNEGVVVPPKPAFIGFAVASPPALKLVDGPTDFEIAARAQYGRAADRMLGEG